jgi:alpha-D-ribose 1-methylphosphonate 5-triphosphate diphosphatase PhnM
MTRHLFDALRSKLVKLHMKRQQCIASHDDFVVERATEADATLVGLV